jgi:RimJ/RimL family protein N-acetyltransferase
MIFHWIDNTPEYATLIDSWLDVTAVKMTGIDEGWDSYWNAVLLDAVNFPGCVDHCKIVLAEGQPVAVVAFGYYRNDVTISEIIVAPEMRAKGYGSRIIQELISLSRIWFPDPISRFSAIVFAQNIASQKVFQNAGFQKKILPDGFTFEYVLLASNAVS